MQIIPVDKIPNTYEVFFHEMRRDKAIYRVQIFSQPNGDKLVLLTELLELSEKEVAYLNDIFQFLATKIYDFFLKTEKNISPTDISWVVNQHEHSHQGKNNNKSVFNKANMEWDAKLEQFCSPKWSQFNQSILSIIQ